MIDMSKSTFVPNSFQTPNGYVDLVMPYLTGEEYKVLIYATRRILGFQKRQDRIALSQFTDGTVNKDGEALDKGTGHSVGTVKECLKSLEFFGLMVKVAENDPKTNEGNMWAMQWDASKVNWQALEERYTKKQEADRKRISKARSMRQPKVVSQTPVSGTEPTPGSPTDPPPTSGTETQKTVETQGNPVRKVYPKFSDPTLEKARRRQMLIERMQAAGINPKLDGTKSKEWKNVLNEIDKFEQSGQRFEIWAKWWKSGNQYDRPKIHQIVMNPSIITGTWFDAFSNGNGSNRKPVVETEPDWMAEARRRAERANA